MSGLDDDPTLTGIFTMDPVGRVRSSRAEPIDDGWDCVEAVIDIDPVRFGPDALQGLDGFSHVHVVFVFDRVDPSSVEVGARRPRGNPSWPEVGIFAQRGKAEPNRTEPDRDDDLSAAVRRGPAPDG